MTDNIAMTAHCACGSLSLDFFGAPVVQLVCHCTDCRSFSGQPYTEAVFFQPKHYRVLGQAMSTTLKGGTGFDKTHHRCARCKTPLYVTVGALNGACAVPASRLTPFQFNAQAHIWTSEKADDTNIPAGAAQSPTLPPKEILDTILPLFWSKE